MLKYRNEEISEYKYTSHRGLKHIMLLSEAAFWSLLLIDINRYYVQASYTVYKLHQQQQRPWRHQRRQRYILLIADGRDRTLR